MKETGVVTEIRGKTSVVSVDRKDECSRCGLCLFKEGTNKTEFFVKSEDGVNVGDTVEIERSESGKFTGVILAFFVPLLFIGLAVAINYLFINSEIWILILSIGFIAVWYAILAFSDKRLKFSAAFNARIVSVKLKAQPELKEDINDYQHTKE